MTSVRPCQAPAQSLLRRYVNDEDFADCYTTTLGAPASLAQFVAAFYTTWVFRLERLILAWAVSRPSTDADAVALAAGSSVVFAAWSVEARAPDQLLMCDFRGDTRSWLMVESIGAGATRLYFGSAVVARADRRAGRRTLRWPFRALLGFHRAYSRILLRAARSKLDAQR